MVCKKKFPVFTGNFFNNLILGFFGFSGLNFREFEG
jgi:hypothetical protein